MGNSKHEIRISKQMQRTEISMAKTTDLGSWSCLGRWISVIRACFGFRISDFGVRSYLPALILLLVAGGCETGPQGTKPPAGQGMQVAEQGTALVPTGFGPAKISILPLSEITGAAGIGQDAQLDVYVALLDAFGCPVKAPCTLRFELYEYVRRSAQAKGQRLIIWPDIDLTRPADNHKSWRDFLRSYEFQLNLRVERGKTYVLEATYLGADGRRLSSECAIRAGQ
jgi:hypothetical protein